MAQIRWQKNKLYIVLFCTLIELLIFTVLHIAKCIKIVFGIVKLNQMAAENAQKQTYHKAFYSLVL